MQRVMIIGCSGSGKSTLARRLGAKTGLPVIHIDKFYWPDGWVLRPAEETQSLIADAIKAREWVFEGNSSATFHLRAPLIDTLVFLDMPTSLCLIRVVSRAVKTRGRVREDMAAGCPERLDWALVKLLKMIWGYKKASGVKAVKFLNEVPAHVAVHRLTSPKAVEGFLARV